MKRIKIELDIPKSTTAYYRLQDRWENEGGNPVKSKEDLLPGDQIPFSPGDTFRVESCSIKLVNDVFYYIVDIEPISEADSVSSEPEES